MKYYDISTKKKNYDEQRGREFGRKHGDKNRTFFFNSFSTFERFSLIL